MACQCFLHGPDAVVDYRLVLEVYNQCKDFIHCQKPVIFPDCAETL